MSSGLKIGMLVDTYLPVIGGAEVHVLELSRALRSMGHSPSVCTGTASHTTSSEEEFQVTRLPALRYSGWTTWLKLPFALPALVRYMKEQDVIHCHYTFFLAMLGTVLGRLLDKPTAVTLHGLGTLDSSVGNSLLMRFCRRVSLRRAGRVIATSQEMREVALRFVPDSRIVVIPNGVDTTHYSPLPKKATGDYVILTMRRLAPKNGVQYLVEAAPMVVAKLPQARFWVAGEGKLEQHIRRRVAELGLQEHFRFIGMVSHDQTRDYYRQADLLVFPSSAESTSLACLEGMAMQKPIVASNLTAYQDMLGDNERGLLVPLFDRTESDYNAPLTLPQARLEALAKAILRLAGDPRRCVEMGERARQYVVANYDWHQVASQTLAAYRG